MSVFHVCSTTTWVVIAVRAISCLLVFAISLLGGCRAVTLVSDSLYGNNPVTQGETALRDAVNDTNGENHIIFTRIRPGASVFQHPVNKDIYSRDLVEAFGTPDVVVLSFGTNDINSVRLGLVSYESALEAFWILVHQAVQAGATCIVVSEWSHKFSGFNGSEHPANAEFTPLVDRWFDDIEQRAGEAEYLGFPYTLLMADVSDTVHGDMSRYIADYFHPTPEGAQLMADAVVSALNDCPEGRWVYNEAVLKEGFEHRIPRHMQ